MTFGHSPTRGKLRQCVRTLPATSHQTQTPPTLTEYKYGTSLCTQTFPLTRKHSHTVFCHSSHFSNTCSKKIFTCWMFACKWEIWVRGYMALHVNTTAMNIYFGGGERGNYVKGSLQHTCNEGGGSIGVRHCPDQYIHYLHLLQNTKWVKDSPNI